MKCVSLAIALLPYLPDAVAVLGDRIAGVAAKTINSLLPALSMDRTEINR
jgi:hypothetical protein